MGKGGGVVLQSQSSRHNAHAKARFPNILPKLSAPPYKTIRVSFCFVSLCPPGLIYDTIGDYTVAFSL